MRDNAIKLCAAVLTSLFAVGVNSADPANVDKGRWTTAANALVELP